MNQNQLERAAIAQAMNGNSHWFLSWMFRSELHKDIIDACSVAHEKHRACNIVTVSAVLGDRAGIHSELLGIIEGAPEEWMSPKELMQKLVKSVGRLPR